MPHSSTNGRWVVTSHAGVNINGTMCYTPLYQPFSVDSDVNVATRPDYRFGLQWRIGSSRVYLEMRAETQEEADVSLRDVALGLAAKLEEWAKDGYSELKPQMAADGGDLYLVGGEDGASG
jgi:hypothetical protein